MKQSKACSSDPSAQRTQTSHPWLSEAGPYRHVRLFLACSASSIQYLFIYTRREDQM